MLDRLVSRVVLGTIAPVSLMLAGWWGAVPVFGDSPLVGRCALTGLAIGVLLDVTVFRQHLDALYRLSGWLLGVIALFYTVMIYGFFMGFPAVNLLVGIGWGFVVGRRHVAEGLLGPEAAHELRAACVTASAIMFALCCATAWLAFSEPWIASEVRGMLGLSFTPSMTLLYAGSVLGGIVLVAGEAWLTRLAARFAATRLAAR
ncbi:MAG TPA: hypothetical protein VFG89_10905 [Coriobacteriia bacterium]|nr:hypothetical protein [Coriobacteriia bacterium]